MELPVKSPNPGRIVSASFLDPCHRERFMESFSGFQLRFPEGGRENVLLCERDPVVFIAAFFAGLLAGKSLTLGNRDWKSEEWRRLFRQVKVDLIVGESADAHNLLQDQQCSSSPLRPEAGEILIPTGGTTGQLSLVRHRWETLTVAAEGLVHDLQGDPIHSLCVLPLFHVSGLMQVVRALVSGGRITFSHWRALYQEELPPVADPESYYLSLVPTQLERILKELPGKMSQLSRLRGIFLGGAAWRNEALRERCRSNKISLLYCYGMTETAAMVTLQPAKDFFDGGNSVGRPLSHVRIKLEERAAHTGKPAPLLIRSDCLFLGYWNGREFMRGEWFRTPDCGTFSPWGLRLAGRLDRVINSGGEKIDPAEIEEVLVQWDSIREAAVFGIPDEEWGESVAAAMIMEDGAAPDEEAVCQVLRRHLASFKVPRKFMFLKEIPRTSLGKVDYSELAHRATR